jgi:hypothetical protein
MVFDTSEEIGQSEQLTESNAIALLDENSKFELLPEYSVLL